MGTFFGALLSRGGQTVHFIARGAQLEALRANGIRIDSTILGTIDVSPIAAFADASEAGERLGAAADLVLVCVKAHQTAGIVPDLVRLAGASTAIVTLQNGVESDEVLAARFGDDRVYPAVVYVGATVTPAGGQPAGSYSGTVTMSAIYF